ncbi:MAG TPA: M48 family metallopeptidase, partial [Actinomycetota bacterium]|nr:M48 family metallopeptidase [Actinomycetota bacterium]
MWDLYRKNTRRSMLLTGGFVLIVLAIGWLFGQLYGGGFVGLAIAAVVATFMTWLSYRNGDKIVLAVSRAREVAHADEPRLHNIVEGLSIAAGIPKPKVYVVEDSAPNAFATGRDPEHASIAVTRGLLEKMNRVELEGVIGHELAHVKNRDTLVMAVAATLLGIVVLISDWTLRAMFWGGGRRRGGRDGGGGAAAFAIIGLVLAILMPIIAQILRATISRQRETLADITGARFTRYPPGLISALEKLRDDQTVVRSASRATAALWIESPLQREQGFMGWLNRLFNTHPPLDERIRVLKEL